MNSKNLVILTGRITRDIDVRTTQSGVSMARFSLAVNRPKKSGEEAQTDFISILAWRQTAEFAAKYFHKGDAMTLIGSIQTGSYTDNEGVSRNSFEVAADSIDFPLTKARQSSAEPAAEISQENGTVELPDCEEGLPF